MAACPYVRTAQGFRLLHPSHEHRCTVAGATDPLPSQRQASLCLTSRHDVCPAYVQAQAVDGRLPETAMAGGRRFFAVTSPTVLQGPSPLALIDLPRSRHSGRPDGGAPEREPGAPAARLRSLGAILAVLVIVGAAALVLNGPSFNGLFPWAGSAATASPPPGHSATPGSSVAESPSASLTVGPPATATPPATASARPSPTPSATPGPSASPSQTPSASPSARSSPGRTYVVQSGDSLWTIARKFGTTVAAIQAANDLTSITIQPGQVLAIP